MAKLKRILQEVGSGKLIVTVQNGKIVSIPEQEVEHREIKKGIIKVTKIKKAIKVDQ